MNITNTTTTGHIEITKPVIEYVTPVERDGVKFYVSADGKKVGLSQSGIGRLAGISESSIRTLLTSVIALQHKRTTPLPDSLLRYAETDIYLPLTSKQNERVVRADVASAVIEYYAFDSPAKNELATFTFRQFAAKGLELWIKEVTGYKDLTDIKISEEAQTNEVLMVLVQEMREMKSQLTLTSGFRNAAPEMPGMVLLTDGYKLDSAKGKAYAEAQETEQYTQNEWVEMSGYKPLNNADKHMLALNISGLYSSMFLTPPEKITRRNGKGMSLSGVAGYPRRHFPILETAYTQMLIVKGQKKAKAEAKKLKRASEIVLKYRTA